ncbi:hypothetical protein D3C80_1129590 [compost metagenome]
MAHAEIHQALAQVGVFDPLRDLGVVAVGHQQRQAEVVQQAFGHALPVARVFVHLDQLASERQLLLVQLQRCAQALADFQAARRDVRATPAQRIQFLLQFLVLLAQAMELHRAFGLAIFRLVARLQAVLAGAGQGLQVGQEGLGRQRLRQFQGAGQFVVLLGTALPALLLGALGVDLGLDCGQAVAAVLGDGAVQLVAPGLALFATFTQDTALLAEARAVLLQIGQALAEQFALELGEPGRQRLAAGGEVLGFGGDPGVALAVLAQRAQPGNLVLGLEHRLVGAVEVVEVVDQRADAFLHRQLFEHMLADEVGEIAHRFHRHGLAEQLQSLLVVDAEAAAEGRAIGAEALFENHVGQLAQALAQGR